MTIEQIRQYVAEIKRCSDDPEQAHYREDVLYLNFLQWLATEADVSQDISQDVQEKASEVLKAHVIKFPRWYA